MIKTPKELKDYLNKVGMPAEPHMMATTHFSWCELLINQKELPSLEILNNLLKAAQLLETYRAKYFNNHSIKITSGWRSVNYNKKIGGAPNSFHCKGMALDFVVSGFTPVQVQKILNPVHKGGLEFAPTWTHIDIGEHRRFRA